MRLSGNFDFTFDSAVRRKSAGLSGGHDTGERFQALQQGPVKTRDLIGSFVAFHWERQSYDENMIRLQSQMHFAKSHETAHQEPRSYQKRERKSDLCDHQRIAEFSMTEAAAEPFAGVAQRLIQVFSGGLQRGGQAKEERSNDSYAQREE